MQNTNSENINQNQNSQNTPALTSSPNEVKANVPVENINLSDVMGKLIQPVVNQPSVTSEEKIYAMVAYIPLVSLISIIIRPDSAYVRLHAKQGLLLAMIFFLALIFGAIMSIFGIIGQLLTFVFILLQMACFVVGVYSMYLAMTGFWWKIPLLGSIADLLPIEAMAKASKENITGQMGIAKNDYDNRQNTLQQEKAEVTQPVPTMVSPNATSHPSEEATPPNQVNTSTK